jgi:ABC-2 type transport system permease protein
MRRLWAFFVRDALIAFSYRASFFAQLAGNLLILGVFFFIGRTVGAETSAALAPYGGNFFAFLLVGLSLGDCVGVSLTTFASQIREGQVTGTLEVTLMSSLRLSLMLIYSSLWNYFFAFVRFVLYLAVGSVLYGVSFQQANIPVALLMFLLTVLSFLGIGVLWASLVLLIKRGEAIMTTAGYAVILISGVLFPPAVLPPWIRVFSDLIPLTHALEGMRLALLKGFGLVELAPILFKLLLFSVVLLAIGFSAFDRAVRRAKELGTLTQF